MDVSIHYDINVELASHDAASIVCWPYWEATRAARRASLYLTSSKYGLADVARYVILH